MPEFTLPDLSCGHCVAAITQAVSAADPLAQLQFDLPQHRLKIEGGQLDEAALAAALREAGYPPA
ncbi:MAG: heavy-metal-associated domain-containing protein [Paucibacter sp.]|nr:heavy-metal-associated domain-containing protein [Roseateles sp.]